MHINTDEALFNVDHAVEPHPPSQHSTPRLYTGTWYKQTSEHFLELFLGAISAQYAISPNLGVFTYIADIAL